MNDNIHDVILNLYDQDSIGVVSVKNVLDTEDLEQVHSIIKVNTDQFYPLKFGNATRWDLVEEDFQKYPALEFCRKNFRRIIETVSTITKINPVYHERFCIQFYPSGSPGVKPHRDTEHSVNCVGVIVISGNNAFFAAKDRACKEVFEFLISPGDMVVMRGPRSIRDTLQRPIHYVGEVMMSRYVVICRHVNLEGLKDQAKIPVLSE